MPCIFCLAVFAMFAGAITTVVLDQLEARLSTIATAPVVRATDSASVARYDLSVAVPGASGRVVPVSVTLYKKHRRIRIQVMTHELTRAEAEAIENLIAATLELRIVDRSDVHDEQKVREAFEHAETEEDEREALPAEPAAQRPTPRPGSAAG